MDGILSMNDTTILDHIIPARGYYSSFLRRGATLRVIDLEGKQVVDLVAINAHDKREKLSCIYSNVLNRTWSLKKGNVLYTNWAKPMLSITDDKVGVHFLGGGFCSGKLNLKRYNLSNMPNCEDNLINAFLPHGISRSDFDFDSCFNIFMNLTYEPDGSMKLEEPLSRPGDWIDLRAEMDCIMAISCCPQDQNPCNAFNPTPVRIQIFSGVGKRGS